MMGLDVVMTVSTERSKNKLLPKGLEGWKQDLKLRFISLRLVEPLFSYSTTNHYVKDMTSSLQA